MLVGLEHHRLKSGCQPLLHLSLTLSLLALSNEGIQRPKEKKEVFES